MDDSMGATMGDIMRDIMGDLMGDIMVTLHCRRLPEDRHQFELSFDQATLRRATPG